MDIHKNARATPAWSSRAGQASFSGRNGGGSGRGLGRVREDAAQMGHAFCQ